MLLASYTVSAESELAHVALDFVQKLGDESIVLFDGEMAAGKTTFIKQICKALGVTDTVSSPTFSIINEYRTDTDKVIYHFDFYRLNSEAEAYAIGAEEYLFSGNLCLIEWPSKAEELLPSNYIRVQIENNNGIRSIFVYKHS